MDMQAAIRCLSGDRHNWEADMAAQGGSEGSLQWTVSARWEGLSWEGAGK